MRKILAADFVLRLFYRIVARTRVYKSKSDYQEWKEKGSVRDKKCCHVLRIFVSQTFHQNPICINTIALVSSWENVLAVMVEVFREKFWRLGDKVLSLPSDSKTNNQTEL